MGIEASDEQVGDLMEKLDSNADGNVDYR